ncbi:TetR/AcrR family transcriptional regulator [Ruania alba]|uniref:TetR/AcrR family transcriptional regulator n=1 Tax=Ruania alba TaxID=648782 RepID=UPI000B7D34B0|nr:TetR/AcrR family transcriptional regulator C-terminal domain-containing protein [Ruania alba]
MSYWEHRKPQRRTRVVDVDGIARISTELLDDGGLRALTIRAVAGKLSVAPASLYSRVARVDDLFDLALDNALAQDTAIQRAITDAGLHDLMLTYYRHLARHRWATQVIAMRAPRGPHYLQLSERMCALLADAGARDPLGAAYALSNFVIGSATTTSMAGDERTAPVDPEIAPLYSRLHRDHAVDSESIVAAGLAPLVAHVVL